MRFPKVIPRKSIFIDSRGRFDIQCLKVGLMLVQALVS